jgi:hypothetical protein
MAAGIIRLGNTRGLFSTALRSSRCAEQIERFGGPMKRIVLQKITTPFSLITRLRAELKPAPVSRQGLNFRTPHA